MITIKQDNEIEKLREGGKILASIMDKLSEAVEPGVKADDLDKMALKLALDNNARPSFYQYRGYPAHICASINNEVVHGIPFGKIIEEGDIVGIDFGLEYKGLYTDMARTFSVGKISKEAKDLMKVTKKSLQLGIEQIKPGNRVGDISAAVQEYVEKKGYYIVRDLTGHGVGYEVHEPPQVPNFGEPGSGPELKSGMVLAIEPMVNIGTDKVKVQSDKWTFKTDDGSLSAHFENTVVVTDRGYEILTK